MAIKTPKSITLIVDTATMGRRTVKLHDCRGNSAEAQAKCCTETWEAAGHTVTRVAS